MEEGPLAGKMEIQFFVWLNIATKYIKQALRNYTKQEEIPSRQYETLSGLAFGALFLDEFIKEKDEKNSTWFMSGGATNFFE